MNTLKTFLLRIFYLTVFTALTVGILALVQELWHPFDSLIAYLNQDISAATSTLKSEALAGISFGALAVFLVLLVIPVLHPGVNTKGFFTAMIRGLLAAGVYVATDYFFTQMEVLGRFYLLAAMAASIVVTFILVEIIVLTGRRSEQKATRTDITASIVSGLAFSMIVKLASSGWSALLGMLG